MLGRGKSCEEEEVKELKERGKSNKWFLCWTTTFIQILCSMKESLCVLLFLSFGLNLRHFNCFRFDGPLVRSKIKDDANGRKDCKCNCDALCVEP